MGADILCIGEALIELGPAEVDGGRQIGFGGDALLTAIHLSNVLGRGRVGFVSRMGDDPFSRTIRSELEATRLDLTLCDVPPGSVSTLRVLWDQGEDRDHAILWDSQGPARRTFDGPSASARLVAIREANAVHLTGAFLAILDEPARLRLLNAARVAARHGAMVSFDPEYQPEMWPDTQTAAAWAARAYGVATVVLASEAHEQALFGRVSPMVPEKVLRRIDAPAQLRAPVFGLDTEVGEAPGTVLDPRGMDAAFNGAYLAARIRGTDPLRAAQAGARLSEFVAAREGALPREEEPVAAANL